MNAISLLIIVEMCDIREIPDIKLASDKATGKSRYLLPRRNTSKNICDSGLVLRDAGQSSTECVIEEKPRRFPGKNVNAQLLTARWSSIDKIACGKGRL